MLETILGPFGAKLLSSTLLDLLLICFPRNHVPDPPDPPDPLRLSWAVERPI